MVPRQARKTVEKRGGELFPQVGETREYKGGESFPAYEADKIDR